MISRTLLCGIIGAIACAFLSFLMFFLLALFDNQKPFEAFAYGLIVGLIGAFVGVIIGLAVGLGNLGMVLGGAVGFLLTLAVVAMYVYSTASNPSQYGYFLGESRIIISVLALPMILTGIITALLKRLIFPPQGRLVSPPRG